MAQEICKICSSDQTKLLYEVAPDYLTGDIFQIWQCSNCQVAYTSPQPKDLSPYYPPNYRRYIPIVLSILKLFYRLRVRRWLNSFSNPGYAFEMGCGNGLMLDSLRKLGWRVLGNERSPEMAYFARHHLGLDVFAGSLDAIRAAPQFDMIILFQVLEHLENPVEVLQQLSKLLKPQGKLVIGVPNFGSWQSQMGKSRWFHLDVPRHLFHYSPTSLGKCLEQVGLEIMSVNSISFEHDPYGWLQTIFNRIDGSHNRLTRLLMQIDRPNIKTIFQLVSVPILVPVCVLLAILSWLFGRGAMLEVIVCHRTLN